MTESVTRRDASLATALVVAVIVHGSLYPYEFYARAGPGGAMEALFASWADPPMSRGDLIANILLYLPFGFFGCLALGGRGPARILAATVAGLLLSTGMELSQFFDAGRMTAASDVYLNTGGTSLGALAAVPLGGGAWPALRRRMAGDPVAVSLLGAMLGYRLFPFVPTIDLHKYWQALKPLVIDPQIAPYAVFRYFAIWLTASCLLGAIVGARPSRWAAALLAGFVFGCKVVITELVLTPSEVAGAAAALGAWILLARLPRARMLIVAAVLCAAIVAQRLEPFEFAATARAFTWLPFRGFLYGSMAVNTASFLEKCFLYGSLLWLLGQARVPLGRATIGVAALLFATSYAEVYLPGRSAEITDTVIVLLIGAVLAVMRPRARSAPATPPAGPPSRG